jgi:hypothetical protein
MPRTADNGFDAPVVGRENYTVALIEVKAHPVESRNRDAARLPAASVSSHRPGSCREQGEWLPAASILAAARFPSRRLVY